MQKLVSKYGLAAHLALLTVAPLVLLPFFGPDKTATVLLWLSVFGFSWVLMEPSRRKGELSKDTVQRVWRAIVMDPLFWFSLVLVIYTAVMAINSGIGMAYDAENMQWFIRQPLMPYLPGCVEHAGYFLFSVVSSLVIVFQGLRHALGRAGRTAFLLVSSIVSATAACVMVLCSTYGHVGVLSAMSNSTISASYFGTVFGLQLLCGLVSLASSIENDWVMAEPLVALGVIGNAVGLAVFAPFHTIAAFALAYLLLIVLALCFLRRRCGAAPSLRFFIVVLLSFGAPALCLFLMAGVPAIESKLLAFKAFEVFPDGYFATRDALSSVALSSWKRSPWLGTGLDSFSFDIRFMAEPSDWAVVSPSQKTALSGWWQLLAEEGVIGAALLAITVGMLLFTYVFGLVRSWSSIRLSAEHFIGPLVLFTLVTVSFVDCSLLRPEVLMVAGALFALSDGALPSGSVTSKVES